MMGKTALHRACIKEDVALVRMLLQKVRFLVHFFIRITNLWGFKITETRGERERQLRLDAAS